MAIMLPKALQFQIAACIVHLATVRGGGDCETWSSWGRCSEVNCTKTRNRTCSSGPTHCGGIIRADASCNCSSPSVPPCQPWSSWGSCSEVNCTRTRRRTCGFNTTCRGIISEGAECNCSSPPAPACQPWSRWGRCSEVDCTKTRNRTCISGPNDCKGMIRVHARCNCSSPSGPNVVYTVRLMGEDWTEELANVQSNKSKALEERIRQNVKTLDFNDSIRRVRVTDLREGSVIADIDVMYSSLDSIQILTFQEGIRGERLGNMSAVLHGIQTPKELGDPPNITEVLAQTSTSIRVTWSPLPAADLGGQQLLGYRVYYTKATLRFQADAWYSVQANVTTVTLENLEENTSYHIVVLTFTSRGNGVSSARASARTHAPSVPLLNVEVSVHGPRKMTVTWDRIDLANVHGVLKGYRVSYEQAGEKKKVVKGTKSTSVILKRLQPFTVYTITVCAYSSNGRCFNSSKPIRKRTRQAVPDKPPGTIEVVNVSLTNITVRWNSSVSATNLTGYKLSYELVRAHGRPVRDVEAKLLTLPPYPLSMVIRDLQSNSEYKMKIAGFTERGTGPYTAPVSAETCRCPRMLYSNFWALPPYVRRHHNSTLGGIFPRILERMVRVACGYCASHGQTVLTLESNGHGVPGSAFKPSLTEMLKDISDVPQLHFPINGNKFMTRYLDHFSYIHLVDSPGVAFVTRSEPPGPSPANLLFRAAFSVGLPLSMVVLSSTFISGVVFWMLERKSNPREISPSFFRGTYEGVWLSFVTMTTVGFGDKAARSFVGRWFTIAWTLVGIVIISMVTGAISTALTAVSVGQNTMIYGSKVAAIQNSTEHRIGILMNAAVNRVRQYKNVKEMHDALESREVDGALVDTYVAAEHQDQLLKDGVRVSRSLDKHLGYGFVLSGDAANAKKSFDDYIKSNIKRILQIIEEETSKLSLPRQSSAEEVSAGLFDGSSSTFLWAMSVVCGMIAIVTLLGLVWHYGIYKRQKKPGLPAKAHLESHIRDMVQITLELQENISRLKREQVGIMRKVLSRRKKEGSLDAGGSVSPPRAKTELDEPVVCESRDFPRVLFACEIRRSFWEGRDFVEELRFSGLEKNPQNGPFSTPTRTFRFALEG